MELPAAEKQLCVRLYRWAVRECEEQLAHGYPRVRELDSLGSGWFLNIIEPLTREQERSLATALLKRRHQKAVEHLGEPPTPAERELADRYMALMRHGPTVPEAGGVSLSRKQLAGLVHKSLSSLLPPALLGLRIKNGTTVELDYGSVFGDWSLWTSISTGRGTFDCDHSLTRSDDREGLQPVQAIYNGHHSFSYGSLLGNYVSTMQTVHTAEEVEGGSTVLAQAVLAYLPELPSWVNGLDIGDPG